MKIWRVQRKRIGCGNMGGGSAGDNNAAHLAAGSRGRHKQQRRTAEKMQASPARLILDQVAAALPGSLLWMLPLKGRRQIPAQASEPSAESSCPRHRFHPVFSPHVSSCTLSKAGTSQEGSCCLLSLAVCLCLSRLLTTPGLQATRDRGCLCLPHVYAAKCSGLSWYCLP